MIRCLTILLAFLAYYNEAGAQSTVPLRSFTLRAVGVGCTGGDYWFSVAKYPLGAGKFPTSQSVLRGFQLWDDFQMVTDYVMVGKTPPFGDAITSYQYGPSNSGVVMYSGAASLGFPFDPTQPGQELHVHYACDPVESGMRTIGLTIFYSLNSDGLVPP